MQQRAVSPSQNGSLMIELFAVAGVSDDKIESHCFFYDERVDRRIKHAVECIIENKPKFSETVITTRDYLFQLFLNDAILHLKTMIEQPSDSIALEHLESLLSKMNEKKSSCGASDLFPTLKKAETVLKDAKRQSEEQAHGIIKNCEFDLFSTLEQAETELEDAKNASRKKVEDIINEFTELTDKSDESEEKVVNDIHDIARCYSSLRGPFQNYMLLDYYTETLRAKMNLKININGLETIWGEVWKTVDVIECASMALAFFNEDLVGKIVYFLDLGYPLPPTLKKAWQNLELTGESDESEEEVVNDIHNLDDKSDESEQKVLTLERLMEGALEKFYALSASKQDGLNDLAKCFQRNMTEIPRRKREVRELENTFAEQIQPLLPTLKKALQELTDKSDESGKKVIIDKFTDVVLLKGSDLYDYFFSNLLSFHFDMIIPTILTSMFKGEHIKTAVGVKEITSITRPCSKAQSDDSDHILLHTSFPALMEVCIHST